MTELRRQDLQNAVDTGISRIRHRDESVPCSAVKKDPDGGLICTQRGMAVASPKIWYGHDATGALVLTSVFQEITIDTEEFTNDDDDTVFSLASNQLELLKVGDLKLDLRSMVRTSGTGRWAFELVIDEDIGAGFVEQSTTIVSGGRGSR
jgi:hypothetical protein